MHAGRGRNIRKQILQSLVWRRWKSRAPYPFARLGFRLKFRRVKSKTSFTPSQVVGLEKELAFTTSTTHAGIMAADTAGKRYLLEESTLAATKGQGRCNIKSCPRIVIFFWPVHIDFSGGGMLAGGLEESHSSLTSSL